MGKRNRPRTRIELQTLEDRSNPTTFTVTNANDSGPGSLRFEIAQAAADGNPDTINFSDALAGAAINLSTIGDTSDGPSALAITTTITIDGTGQRITRLAYAPAMRLFDISATGNLTLENLTLSSGVAEGDFVDGSGGLPGLGGAIVNHGKLTAIGVLFAHNKAHGGSATDNGGGGNTGGGTGGGGGGSTTGGGGFTGGGSGSTGGGGATGGGSGSTGDGGGFTGGGGSGSTGGSGGDTGGSGGDTGGGGGDTGGGGGDTGGGGGDTGGGGGDTGGGGGDSGDFIVAQAKIGSKSKPALSPANAGYTGGGGSISPDFITPDDDGSNFGQGVDGGGGAGMGGAIFNDGGTAIISDSTFTTNAALGGSTFGAGGGYGNGGAIFNLDGDLTLTNDTFSANTVAGGTGGLNGSGSAAGVYNLSFTAGDTATLTLANNIFADKGSTSDVINNQVDGSAVTTVPGPNIVMTSVQNIKGTMSGTAYTITNPDIGPLAENGGYSQTFALNPGSPAIDAGSNAEASGLTFDQRGPGFDRIVNGTVDIGAFEVQATPLPSAQLPLTESGSPNGQVEIFDPSAAGTYTSSPTTTIEPFGNIATDVRTAVADVNGDGIPDIICITGPGEPMQVAVVSGANDSTLLVSPIEPFGAGYTDGGLVSAGDLDNSGRAAFAVTPDKGGGPRVRIYELTPGGLVSEADFFGIDDPNFRGGARTAIGDVNGDGTPDLVVAAGTGGGPRIAVFDGTSLIATSPSPIKLMGDFFAFEPTLRNGSFVAVGDVNGDGFGDIIFGAGPGGAPRVLVVSGERLITDGAVAAIGDPLSNFYVNNDTSSRGGIHVAVTNADGDDRADVAVGSGPNTPSLTRVYLGKDFVTNGQPFDFETVAAFGTGALSDGVFVG